MKKYEIVNLALQAIGEQRITEVTLESTKASKAASFQYKYSLDAVLASHPWDIFKKLTRLTSEEHAHIEFGYAYEFRLPIDFVRFIEEEPKGIEYTRAAGRLLANVDPFEFSYVALPTTSTLTEVPDLNDVPNWNDLPGEAIGTLELDILGDFALIIAYHIAYNIAYAITGDHNDVQLLEAMYTKLLTKGTSVQAQQSQDRYIETSEWIDSRGA